MTPAAFVVWLLAMAFATLRPLGWLTPVPFWSFYTTTMAATDIVQNVVLYLPLGWTAQRARWPLWRTAVTALAISGAVELAQHWIPGRASTASDMACNALGAVLAWVMAAPVQRPRVRAGVAVSALAAALSLHVMNTRWPHRAAGAFGNGATSTLRTAPCPREASSAALCFTVPNAGDERDRYVRVAGPADVTYARVQRSARGARLSRADCVLLSFESTVGAQWRFRPPLYAACGVADVNDSVITVEVDPRREYDPARGWLPTRASVWLWPLWPFNAYQPMLLRTAGAAIFVVGAALLMAAAPWWLPVGYIAALAVLGFVAPMRMPGWWDIGWAVLAWGVAVLLVRADAWWRGTGTATATG